MMRNATEANQTRARRGRLSILAALGPTYGALAALVLLVLFNAIFAPNFATASNFWNILLQASPTILVSVGMTMVVATGGIDLSVGSVMAIASALAATLLDRGVAVAAAAGLAAAFAAGCFNGALVSAFRIQPIIATLAMLIAGRGIAQVMSDGQLIPFSNPAFESLGKGYFGPVPVQVLVMAVMVIALPRPPPVHRLHLVPGPLRPRATALV